MQHYSVIALCTGPGVVASLDFVEIGRVFPSGVDDYNFEYGPQEDINSVWNGML